ncbi:MAG: DUF3990 domain-containing protein [Lachnospiraceae bacterium]|nr:DUF3990 domain-containing protein [Lachnospiraceae bacterium]
MIVYHGSDHIVEKPVYHAGTRRNDYGYGFYCTAYEDMAKEWSVTEGRSGYANRYELDMQGLEVLDLNEYPVLTWLTVLVENRNFQLGSPLAREAVVYLQKEFAINYRSFDVIRGYRADDSYFSFAQDFLNGTISVSQLAEAMQLGELGEQIVLVSRKAFDSITYLDSIIVDDLIWYPKRKARDDRARSAYHSTDKRYVRGDIYITRIIDEEMKRDDERLQ